MNWFKDKQAVEKYAKKRIFQHCYINYNQLKTLCKNLEFRGQLFNSITSGDIDSVFKNLK
jgi:hypothetical protein